MKKDLIAFILFVGIAVVGSAQDNGKPGLTHKKPAVAANAKSPVTQNEASTVFDRVRKVMSSVLSVRESTPNSIPKAASPARRAQIVKEMDRLFAAAKPAFKYTPIKVRFDPSVLSAKDPATKASMQRLISWGFLAKVGPLATSSKDSIGVEDFGDALGFFIARMAELTHTPSIKWSPYLKAD